VKKCVSSHSFDKKYIHAYEPRQNRKHYSLTSSHAYLDAINVRPEISSTQIIHPKAVTIMETR
jgi:hypothetical protein